VRKTIPANPKLRSIALNLTPTPETEKSLNGTIKSSSGTGFSLFLHACKFGPAIKNEREN